MIPPEKPETPGDALQHYGKKGMRWGIRNEDDEDGGGNREAAKTPVEKASHNAETKKYMAAAKKIPEPTPTEAKANLAKNQTKFVQKFEPSEAPKKGEPGQIVEKQPRLTPGQKKALIYGGAAVATYAALWYAGDKIQKKQLSGLGLDKLDDIDMLAGKPIDAKRFHGLVGLSQGKTWMGGSGYITDSAFARPAFELPAGHTFHRISTKAEEGFKGATYALHSEDDFRRYVAGFRHEKGPGAEFTHITWRATAPIKVPDLTTVLGQMSATMKEHGMTGHDDPQEVMATYQALSGGGWSTGVAKGLIDRLKGHGYGALVDEMDAGVIGETPLVFFGTESAGKKTAQRMGPDAISRAEKLLREIDKPPGRKY